MTDTARSETASSIQNPTAWSDYDFLEFECFTSKVAHEGFTYAAENYGPEFESPELQTLTSDLTALRRFYRDHNSKVEVWYETVGMSLACDLHNDHVDEVRRRGEDACLFAILCEDGFVLTCHSEKERDYTASDLLAHLGKGWRVPTAMLRRAVPGGKWVKERVL